MNTLNTKPDELLFLEESEAQRVLDKKDPGHTIKVTQGGKIARVYDAQGNEVVKYEALMENNS